MEAPDLPLVSVVTPSYNMGRFLEETILSVLNQDYPNLEYIVIDGGSTDESLKILERYQGRLIFESAPDKGQTDAINKGFLKSRGSIFAFLCADDTYLPGAISTAVKHLLANPGYGVIYGNGYLIAENGERITLYPTSDCNLESLKKDCPVCQPAVFMRRQVFESAGMLDAHRHFGLDYDLWIRVARQHRFLRIDDYLANSRMHFGAKTLRYRRTMNWASVEVTKKHFGYAPFRYVYAYCCSLLDKRDGFFEPVPASIAKYALSLCVGSFVNARHLLRYWKESLLEGTGALKRGAWPITG